MTTAEAVAILRQHNAWRRGDGRVANMVDPTLVGEAIDTACNAVDALIESDRMYRERALRMVEVNRTGGSIVGGASDGVLMNGVAA